MSEFMAVLECIAARKSETEAGGGENEPKSSSAREPTPPPPPSLQPVNEAELEDQVNDLLEIKKKDILRKDLKNILRENLELKIRVRDLEERLKSASERSGLDASLSFRIDTDGREEEEETSGIVYTEQTELLTNSLPEEKEEPVQKIRPANTCFNCLGDHMIAECPEPRDQRRIAKNRKEFQSKTVGYNSARYHVDEPQKYGHLKPGLPSAKLREALRLKDNQLPEYIYKMRLLGYPPGWMKHAEISHSGMNLYLDNGQKLGDLGEEEGEVSDPTDKARFDIERLVDWPGFNSPLPKQFRDDTGRYRAPLLSRCQMLKEMVEELRPREQKAYVRGKMQEVSTENNTSIVLSSDTELEEGEEEDKPAAQNTSRKRKNTAKEEPEVGEEKMEEEEEEEMEGEAIVFGTPSAPNRSRSSGSISKTEPGTPIVEIFSPFAKLPKYANWGVGMTEHVVFENLPDYTGTYDKMTGLIDKIRQHKKGGDKSSP